MILDSASFVAEPGLIQVLSERSILLDCAKDREIFCQGNTPSGLFVLFSGEASMASENDRGSSQVIRVPLAPGSVLGLPALVSDKPYSMTAVAKRGAEIGFVPRSVFSSLMLTEPLLALMVVRVLAAEVHGARTAISEYKSSPHRRRARRRKIPVCEIRTRPQPK